MRRSCPGVHMKGEGVPQWVRNFYALHSQAWKFIRYTDSGRAVYSIVCLKCGDIIAREVHYSENSRPEYIDAATPVMHHKCDPERQRLWTLMYNQRCSRTGS